jgi:hypothetical protein
MYHTHIRPAYGAYTYIRYKQYYHIRIRGIPNNGYEALLDKY